MKQHKAAWWDCVGTTIGLGAGEVVDSGPSGSVWCRVWSWFTAHASLSNVDMAMNLNAMNSLSGDDDECGIISKRQKSSSENSVFDCR